LTDDRAFGADDAARAPYAGQRLRKLRFLMTDYSKRLRAGRGLPVPRGSGRQ